MPVEQFLLEAVTILGASVLVLLACNRLRLPSVAGLLLTGILIGPSGLGLVADRHRVELFAELGVVLLLFAVGLEFSLERLRDARRPFFVGGSVQALLTIALTAGAALGLGQSLPNAAFLGFVITLSSTAIVLKLYGDRRELDAPHGKVLLGILLFQDFLVVPMIVLTPVLAGTAAATASGLAVRFGGSLAAVAAVFLAARYLMPRLLHFLVATRVREALVLGSLAICLGLALFTESLGFSLALGAFLAGILVAESEYSHQVVADTAPFRDVFTSVFFVSVGMLVDVAYAATHLGPIVGLAASIVILKAACGAAAVRALELTTRTAVLVGLGLAQIGEFSFLLLEVGRSHGLLQEALYQTVLSAAVLTMLVTPALVQGAPGVAARMAGRGASPPPPEVAPSRVNHVIVVGFGVNGSLLTRVLKEAHIPYVVIELNGHTVRTARRQGEPILFGDATRPEILHRAGLTRAQVIVFGISDLSGVRHGVRLARNINPSVHIIVRTRLVDEIDDLRACGADEVIAEEFETAIEIFTRVLACYHVPRNVIRAQTRVLRGEGYRMLRSPALDQASTAALLDALAAGTTDIFRVEPGSPADGRTLRDLDLRRKSGAMVIAVVRGEDSHPNPAPELQILPGDCLVLVGSHDQVDRGFDLLGGTRASAQEPPEAAAEIETSDVGAGS